MGFYHVRPSWMCIHFYVYILAILFSILLQKEELCIFHRQRDHFWYFYYFLLKFCYFFFCFLLLFLLMVVFFLLLVIPLCCSLSFVCFFLCVNCFYLCYPPLYFWATTFLSLASRAYSCVFVLQLCPEKEKKRRIFKVLILRIWVLVTAVLLNWHLYGSLQDLNLNQLTSKEEDVALTRKVVILTAVQFTSRLEFVQFIKCAVWVTTSCGIL